MENIDLNNPNALNTQLSPSLKTKPILQNHRFFGKKIDNFPQQMLQGKKPHHIKQSNDIKYPWKILNISSSSSLSNIPTKNKFFCCFRSNKLLKCDEEFKSNPQYITDYINDIFKDMYLNNSINKPEWEYFEVTQEEINVRMRAVLLDWLMEVHLRFKLRQETLYLCVIILDRFLALRNVTKDKLQLYGITSLFIASKFEEIYPPEVRDLVYITNNCYKQEEIIQAEREMLSVLDYNLLTIYSYTILERLHFMTGFPKDVFHLAQYLLELSMYAFKASCINDYNKALGSLYMAKVLMKAQIQEKFSQEIQEMLMNNKNEIGKFCAFVTKTIHQMPEYKLFACAEKFKSNQFSCVSVTYLTK